MPLYIHIPFCLHRCGYCNFFSTVAESAAMAAYCRGIRLQARLLARVGLYPASAAETIFFGGGTPTVLPARELTALLHEACSAFALDPAGCEVTIEANPATCSYRDLQLLRLAGFNRLSLGVQSFQDSALRSLGRIHSAAEALQAIRDARMADFRNVSLDLMYGLPGQSLADWRISLELALATGVEHLSLYELTVEEGTPLARQVARGEIALPDEDAVLAMMELTADLTAAAGLARYEISNYAKAGRECAHNINYWCNGVYLGLGPGAVSCLEDGRRCSAPADLERWLNLVRQGGPGWEEEESLDTEARFRETVIMGLRMLEGVSLSSLQLRFGIAARDYYGEILERMLGQGLLCIDGDFLRLSPTGLPLANRVMAELV